MKTDINNSTWEIRHIKDSDDRSAISRIYEESWKFAYHGIIPQSFLDSIPAGNWAAHLDDPAMNSLVISENGRLIGTSSYRKSRFAEFCDFGEIVSIYLMPDHIGKGYGKALMQATIGELSKLGYNDIFLWILEDNERARKFYEKAGFTCSGRYLEDNIGGKALRDVQYVRKSLPPVSSGL